MISRSSEQLLPNTHPVMEKSSEAKQPKPDANYLTGWKLIATVISLNAANGVAFVDLLGVTAILPVISDHFTTGGTIVWAATTQLIGATVGLAILGYLSDTWSRRLMLLVSVALLVISALACALSHYQTSTDLFCALRTFAGIATGSISNLVNIAQNDFLPERKRLKYQGVQGTSVAVGSILGMMVGGAFASDTQWQYLYYFEVGLAVCAWFAIFFFVPANTTPPKREQIMEAFRTIDFYGIASGIGFVVPGLLLLSEYHQLDKTILITLAVVTAVSAVIFLVLGFLKDRGEVRPIVPFRLFRNRTIAVILVQNVLFGATYYSFNYYMPVNLQVVREFSALKASAYQIPYYVTHGAWSTFSALIILRLQRMGWRSYSLIFLVGFAVWTVAMAMLAVDSEFQTPGLVIFLVILVGIGTGSSFQNSVMAISAQADKETKGLAVGTRNVLRFFGGALGTAISSAVMRNRLDATLPAGLGEDFHIAESTFSHSSLERLSEPLEEGVQEAYDGAIAWVFGIAAGMVGICFVLSPLIRDNGRRKDGDQETVQLDEGDRSETEYEDDGASSNKTPGRGNESEAEDDDEAVPRTPVVGPQDVSFAFAFDRLVPFPDQARFRDGHGPRV